MKAALRKGDYKTLNIYFQNLADGLLGYAYLPKRNPSASDKVVDGVSILFTSVPGGGEKNYDQGRTVTHEVGHWYVALESLGDLRLLIWRTGWDSSTPSRGAVPRTVIKSTTRQPRSHLQMVAPLAEIPARVPNSLEKVGFECCSLAELRALTVVRSDP